MFEKGSRLFTIILKMVFSLFSGINLDADTNKLISTFIKTEDSELKENSPIKLLLEQQKKASSFTQVKSMKWHPVLVRWSLSIYIRSPGEHFIIKTYFNFFSFVYYKLLLLIFLIMNCFLIFLQ